MKRIAIVVGLLALAGACNKPSEESCRKALANMKALLGTESAAADVSGDVRRCRGGSSKRAVDCAVRARTLDELRGCDLFKLPAARGSAAGGSGSDAGSSAGAAPK
jgi:hypothetical protein